MVRVGLLVQVNQVDGRQGWYLALQRCPEAKKHKQPRGCPRKIRRRDEGEGPGVILSRCRS